MSAAHMVTVQVDTYNFEMTVSFSRSRQAILPSHHIIAVMVGIAFVAGSRNIPMASGIDGTRSRWLAVTPVCKMNFGGFLIYDFQLDGVCGLSPTLVQIGKGQSLSLSFVASGIVFPHPPPTLHDILFYYYCSIYIYIPLFNYAL